MYKTGSWGEKAKARSKARREYFIKYHKDYFYKYVNKIQSNGYTWKSNYIYEKNRKSRKEMLKIMGNKCIKCGYLDWRALQVDHINGGGSKDRKEQGTGFWEKVIKSYKSGEGKYQLLCANCNFIKRYENNEVKRKGVQV